MDNSLDLPADASKYYRLAQQNLSQNNYSVAYELLLKSYQLEKNPEVFEELIYLLLHYLPSHQLKQTWETYYPVTEHAILYQEPRLLQLYAQSLPLIEPQATSLLELYRIQAHQQANGWDNQVTAKLIDTIEQQISDQQHLLYAIQHHQLEHYLTNLLTEGPTKLLQLLNASYHLPLEQVEAFYLLILSRFDVIHYLKSHLLHYLIDQHYTASVQYAFLGEIRLLDLTQLSDYSTQASYHTLKQVVQAYCEKENPHLLTQLMTQVDYHYLSYFPYFDQLFSSPAHWFDLFLNLLFQEPSHLQATTANQQQLTYIQQMNQELMQMLLTD